MRAVLLGVSILDEPLGWRLMVATALVVLGLVLLSVKRQPVAPEDYRR